MDLSESIRTGLYLGKMSKLELSKQLGVTYQTVCKWHRGEANPPMETVKAIADLFDVPVSTFISWGEQE